MKPASVFLPWKRGRRAVPGATVRLAAVVALLAVLSGCASNDYLTIRRIPRNPLAAPLQLLSRKGPQPTPRTEQLLRRYDLAEATPQNALAQLQAEIAAEPSGEMVYSFAELAYIQGRKAETLGDQAAALDMYGAAVAHAYLYLFDPRFDLLRNPYDPQFRAACDLYNGALEAALRIVNRSGKLHPGASHMIQTGSQTYEVIVVSRGPWREQDFERIEFVSDFEIKGLTNRHHTYGLGVPLIVVRRQHPEHAAAERYYPPGLSFPATAFLRVLHEGPAAEATGSHCRRCLLELHDPVVSHHIQIAGRTAPLETDLTTPLGYFLDNPAFQKTNIATWGLLNPGSTQAVTGLYMLEPFDAAKIPVVFVHGLWSSPLTWMEMFNDLRSFPEIRDHFQFWFYLYPTGQPFWFSAAQMRRDLAEAQRVLDQDGRGLALQQMVLVGHSMGGLVSELQTIESGDRFWKIVSDRPFHELSASPEERDKLRETLFFPPNPSVRRLITIGTPHRGSSFANDYTRWLGRKVITLPQVLVQSVQHLIQLNPGAFRNAELLTITTSIDSLAPESPFLPVMLTAPKAPWVKHHNIVGVAPEDRIVGKISANGDGVVSFASAHLDEVESEIVVNADHMQVHRHPRTILEVRRILLQHLASLRDETPLTAATPRR